MEGDRKDPSGTTLVSHHRSAHQGMLSIKPIHSKEDYTPGFSLHQSRLYESGFFFSICKTTSRFYIMVSYNTLDTAVLTVGTFHQPSGEL